MKITGYRLLTTTHDWGRPIGDINGTIEDGVTSVPVVLLETDSGQVGVGVGTADGFDRVFPALEGEDPRAVAYLYDRMLAQVFKTGHAGEVFGAIGAFDMALWDLKAKAADQPLWRLLGGADRYVPGYASALCWPLTEQRVAEVYGAFAERGFGGAKLKGGRDAESDKRRLTIVRDVLRTNVRNPALMVDINEALLPKQALRHVAAIEKDLDLTWVEEPVRRWDAEGHAHVGRGIRAAIASGENLTGLEQYRQLLELHAVDIVQAGSVWGITHFLRVSAVAHFFDLPVSPVAYLTNPLAHAAATIPNHLVTEVQTLRFPRGLQVDQEFDGGGIILGDQPGLGITVDETLMVPGPEAPIGKAPATGPHVRPRDAGRSLVSS